MKIEIKKGDITQEVVDAIVNAANSSLLGGGGVDGAIHRKGGPQILDECQLIRAKQGKCKVGQAVITGAGKLSARHVIHTVGPHWNGGSKKEAENLASCYRESLKLAVEHACRTIAFPCISTGIYRYPKEEAARIAVETVRTFPEAEHIDKVVFVCFDEESYTMYNELCQTISNI
jgi:O-acetyl-ADP-ribose deacetylase (regulator of RNase III)